MKIGVIIFLIVMTLLACLSMWQIFKGAEKFFNKANELEKSVKETTDKQRHIEELMELKKLSFHRNTGSRLREIAKLMEYKYDIKILKN